MLKAGLMGPRVIGGRWVAIEELAIILIYLGVHLSYGAETRHHDYHQNTISNLIIALGRKAKPLTNLSGHAR